MFGLNPASNPGLVICPRGAVLRSLKVVMHRPLDSLQPYAPDATSRAHAKPFTIFTAV